MQDLTVAGLGVRSTRYAMVVEDGKVSVTRVSGILVHDSARQIKAVAKEDAPGELKVSDADSVLKNLL